MLGRPILLRRVPRRHAESPQLLIQGGFNIGDGFEQIVGILLQLCECLDRLFRIDAQSCIIKKMGLPNDCGAALVGCDQEREDRGWEGVLRFRLDVRTLVCSSSAHRRAIIRQL